MIIAFKEGVILMQKGAASNEEAVAGWLAFKKEIQP